MGRFRWILLLKKQTIVEQHLTDSIFDTFMLLENHRTPT